jgi:protein O-mannosyl-transferase
MNRGKDHKQKRAIKKKSSTTVTAAVAERKGKEVKQQTDVKRNSSTIARAASPEKWKYYALAIIVMISFIAYFPVLHNGLLYWDDDGYIKNNPLIYSINLKELFSQNVMGNFHPLTILTLAIEYHYFGLNETGYHAFNLLLHLLNVILVFYVVFILSDKVGVALVASLLFGIHPLHVESVAWAAELKDLLYTFFFLASYIFYLNYLKNRHKKFYVIAILLFTAALLSKALAASLPVVLLLTDYFKGRKINIKTLLEKMPFFLLAIVFGIVAVLAQKSEGATDVIDFTFTQHILFACYGFISYLFKLIFPLHLCAYYPYPIKSGENIPLQYYTYLILVISLVASVFYSLRYTKKILFGIGFFSLTIFLVLQLFPVGSAIMADRYNYVPSLGIFYLAGEGFIFLWGKKQKISVIILLIGVVAFFSVKTYTRCGVWKNDMTLWNDVLSQYQTVPVAYNNRGNLFLNEKEYDRALNDYNKAIELNPNYSNAYFNRGNLFRNEKVYDRASDDYSKAIELNPIYSEAFINRGIVFMFEKKYDRALNDFNKSIELNPKFPKAYNNRGNVFYYEKKYEEAISDFSKAIVLKNDYAEAYYNRGLAEYHSGKSDAACMDLKKSAGFGYKPATDKFFQICN